MSEVTVTAFLFSVEESRGIIRGKVRSELRQWYEANWADYRYLAKASCAGGILEGLYTSAFFHD